MGVKKGYFPYFLPPFLTRGEDFVSKPRDGARQEGQDPVMILPDLLSCLEFST